jgi:hypothetical protein
MTLHIRKENTVEKSLDVLFFSGFLLMYMVFSLLLGQDLSYFPVFPDSLIAFPAAFAFVGVAMYPLMYSLSPSRVELLELRLLRELEKRRLIELSLSEEAM